MRRRELLKVLGIAATGAFRPAPAWARFEEDTKPGSDATSVIPLRALLRKDGALFQPISVTVQASAADSTVITKLDGDVGDALHDRALSCQTFGFLRL